MTTSIRLFRGAFGHVSVLNVGSNFVTHAHAEAHLIVWLEGTPGEMTVGGRTVRLGPDRAAGINEFEPHSHAMAADGAPGLFLAFYIDPAWARRRRALAPGAPLFAQPAIALDAWLHRAATALYANLLDEDGIGEFAAYEIERFIDSMLDAAPASRPNRQRAEQGGRDPRVCRAIALMREHVCERACFDEVARAVGLSRPHFFALFKEQTGLTPNVYWNTLRMEEAQRQLQGSREPLTSVAWNLGFTTQGNFSRFFRDHAGVPPTLYREAARAGA